MLNKIRFVGDLHCGGHWGIAHPGHIPAFHPRSGVHYLYECWQHMLDNTGDDIDLLVLTGDLIEGKQRKSGSVGLFTASLGEQVDMAIEVLRPLTQKVKQVVRVSGTAYHESEEDPLGQLDAELGITHAQQILTIKLDVGVLSVAHHPPGGNALYQGTKMDRALLWSTIQEANAKIPGATWIVRAHLHEFATLRRKGKQAVQLPCWKLSDPYAKKLDYERFQPDLGYCDLVRDEDDALGYKLLETIYDQPAECLEVIEL